MNEKIILDLEGIKRYVKIRTPLLMVDGAEVIPGESAYGYKNFQDSEEFWKGHYPNYPLLPGTYQLEAMSQVFSLAILTNGEYSEIPKLVGYDDVRFYKEVLPNSKLEITADVISYKRGLAKGNVIAKVKGEIVCKALIKSVFS